MDNVTDRLSQLSRQLDGPPSELTVSGDVARGRAALRRRRARVGAIAGGTLGLALLTAAVVGVSASGFSTSRGGDQYMAVPMSEAPSGVRQAQTIKLVSYTGKQPQGFVVEKVPEGYTSVCSNTHFVVISPDSSRTDCDYLPDFTNRILVSQPSPDGSYEGRDRVPVTVHGRPAFIYTSSGEPWKAPDGTEYPRIGGIRTLVFNDGTRDVLIQLWNNIALSNEQLVEFANGVTTTSDIAPPARG